MTSQKITVKVWDPLIRIGHWTLVAAFFTAYFTEDDLLTAHVWAGYTVGAYLLLRILWGFIGTRYARFRHFVYPPAKTVDYLRNLIARRPQHYIGHNPAGGAMVMALLISLTATTLTGLKLYAVEEHKGPLALTDKQFNKALSKITPVAVALAEDEEDKAFNKNKLASTDNKKAESLWEESHELFANLTLLLVVVHVAGVILSSRIDRENLVKTMINGKKEIDDSYR